MADAGYPLAVRHIGEDTYIVISKGHHDIHAFMAAVRDELALPMNCLGVPEHIWMKSIPVSAAKRAQGYVGWYEPVKEGTRGAWPCTYVTEGYHEDSYAAKFPQHASGVDAARKTVDGGMGD